MFLSGGNTCVHFEKADNLLGQLRPLSFQLLYAETCIIRTDRDFSFLLVAGSSLIIFSIP